MTTPTHSPKSWLTSAPSAVLGLICAFPALVAAAEHPVAPAKSVTAKSAPPPVTAPTPTAAVPATPDADGEVRKIDKAAGTVTLKHGDIPSLDMMGMTMVFKVKDRAMLDGVAVGNKVRFSAERQGGSLVVTQWVLQK